MGRSIIGGLIADGCRPKDLWVVDTDQAKLKLLRNDFDVNTTSSGAEAITGADVVVLAVKPQVMHEVAHAIQAAVEKRKPLVISVAAGIRVADLSRWLGNYNTIVRTMPNTPALVRSGATALYANPPVTSAQRNLAESIMRAVGITLWVSDEILMDAVTAVSGSGPAYFFLVMEAMENSGHRLGLPRESARLLAMQTAYGAAKMALESNEGLAELRQRVTSPGGTTEQAIRVMQEQHLEDTFAQALQAAYDRAAELASMLGEG